MTLTDLEAEVAWLLRKGRDPWQAMQCVGGSFRRVSQTLGRLQRKGAVAFVHTAEGSKWTVTPEGSSALDAREPRR
jgi:hypothetical protein